MLSIGIDDTDSREGLCTTYLAFKITQFLVKRDVKLLDYPLLIRLNPNVPWKTRGNGAICIRVEDNNYIDDIINIFDRYSYVGKNTNPGLIIYKGRVEGEIIEFSRRALHTLIPRSEAYKVASKYDTEIYFKGNGQGLVGALAAIGNILYDHTYEIIAYRSLVNTSKRRVIRREDVILMDKETYPYTFNNYDYKHKRVLITPHGPDPVFLGIRGENPKILLKAFSMLKIDEELEGYMIFKSNQGTNAHLEFKLDNLKPYHSGYIEGNITTKPYTINGGHTFFAINYILCAVYEPTGLSKIAQRLIPGDKIKVGGGVRRASKNHPRVLNVEYIQILELAKRIVYINPLCSCGKRLKSAGIRQGYKCEYCNYKGYKEKEAIIIERDIKEGLYLPLTNAQRHLTKPLHRYNYNKLKDMQLIPEFISSTLIRSSGGWIFG